MTQRAIFVGAGLLILGAIAFGVYAATRPPEGQAAWEDIPTQEAIHIESGQPYEPYNSDPPTSGAHYGEPMVPMEAGFYESAVPDENLVHSLEHGYVIIWYDSEQAGEGGCEALKENVREAVEAASTFKVIGAPASLSAVSARYEFPHMTRAGVPFMNRATGSAPMTSSICSRSVFMTFLSS